MVRMFSILQPCQRNKNKNKYIYKYRNREKSQRSVPMRTRFNKMTKNNYGLYRNVGGTMTWHIPTETELKRKTMLELKEYARDLNIPVTYLYCKSDIIAQIRRVLKKRQTAKLEMDGSHAEDIQQ